MSEWTVVTLDEIGQIFDGPHATPTRQTVGPYFLNIASLSAGRLDLSSSDHVSTEDFAKWTRRVTPRADDLLFSYETRLGEAALMPAGIEACLGRRMALIRPKRDRVDPRFLLYLYLAPQFQLTIEQNTIHGATVNRIPLNRMGSWEVSLPSVPEQRGIAEVLGALDNKIAANTALAATARDLGVAMLRIDAPTTELGNLVLHHKRQINPARMDEDVVEHYSLPAFDSGGGPEMVTPNSIKSNKFAVDTSAVLVSKLNPQTPRVWPINAGTSPPRLASTEFLVLEPFVTNPWVMWGLLSQSSFTAALQGLVAGTSGSHQRVRPEEVLATAILDPRSIHPRLLADVGEILAPVDVLLRENRILAATRDALLPQLMSGKLRVRDAQAAASEAGA
jgi:type I restriction enzyme S subunit